MPERSLEKKGSEANVRAGLAKASPQAPARDADNARAARLGCHPISSAIARMRRRVGSDTPGWPLSA
jgi:hypothetical protein